MFNPLYVQYGCGWSAPAEWRNFDASPTLRFERLPLLGRLYTKNKTRFPENAEYGDIVAGLPVPPQSCRAVYCSHILEHLSLHDFRVALTNTAKILAPEGIFRLVVPDLRHCAEVYLSSSKSEAAHDFMKSTYLGHERRARGVAGLLSTWLGNSQHLWMWDYPSMKLELERAGFVDIRRACFNDSADSMFLKVEDCDRWENCLGVECRRG